MTRALRTNARTDWGGNFAFLVTVVGAFVALFLTPREPITFPEAIALVLLGLAFAAVGTYGIRLFGRPCSALHPLLFFAIQIPVACAILYLSHGSAFMGFLLLPLASQAVLILPHRWMLAVCALIVVVEAALYGLLGGPSAFVQAGIGYAVGALFVVVFTRVAVNERHARAEVERLAAELAEANGKLREYAAQVEELAIAKERTRLAREIHDSVAHYLTTINIQLEAAQAVVENDRPRALDALRKAQMLTKDGLTEIRRSVAALRESPMRDRPLPEAVQALAEECRAAGILPQTTVLGTPRTLNPQAELTFFRVAQEALTNVKRHSHASRVEINLDYRDARRVCLVVQDNGVGTNAEAGAGGFGLLGARERVQLLNGTLRTSGEREQGFTVEMEIPG